MALPQTYRKMMVTSLSTNFRKAIEIQRPSLPKLSGSAILVKNRYVGINASDVNFTAGKYNPGTQPPFEIGFEAIGEVVDAGDESKHLIGSAVAHMSGGTFSEYQKLQPSRVFKIPSAKPEYLPLLVSGITAKLALDMNAKLRAGEKVLITAAAGGTGQFAVQLAKLAGCHVIGTCSTAKKDLKTTLKKEYSSGIDVVYETVGGKTFDTCVNALNLGGRLIVIGYISGYQESMPVGGTSARSLSALPIKLLMKSASVSGFFLLSYPQKWGEAFKSLSELYADGKLRSYVDQGVNRDGGNLEGIDGIPDAIDYMYSRKSIGKVFVDLCPGQGSKL